MRSHVAERLRVPTKRASVSLRTGAGAGVRLCQETNPAGVESLVAGGGTPGKGRNKDNPEGVEQCFMTGIYHRDLQSSLKRKYVVNWIPDLFKKIT